MKIAIVVQGRFHAFDLARALLKRGHDVAVFTNYPKWAVKKFSLSPSCVRGFVLHGILSRIAYWLRQHVPWFEPERWLHPLFGRWAAAQVAREQWDVIHMWSGVSEEILRREDSGPPLKMIMRGSAHVREQGRLLEEEERRTGFRLDRPGPWIAAREEREYCLADRIVVLSTFAYQSFRTQGFGPDKLGFLPLGSNTAMFRPGPDVIEARCRRILSGQPLSVLCVGTLSFRKGMRDAADVVKALDSRSWRFRFVGPATAEVRVTKASLSGLAEFVPKQSQHLLPGWYASSDVFIFPTLEDGFAVVLAQAQASGLPILTTTNCCGPDLIREGETGWVLPIRSPEAFVERLLWCDVHRSELAEMVRHCYERFRPRDWDDVAADFESLCAAELATTRLLPAAPNGR